MSADRKIMTQSWLKKWLESHSMKLVNEKTVQGKWPTLKGVTGVTPLIHEDVLKIAGEDAVRFLQGQTTCDVQKLAEGETVPGACCNPKGRMIANFRVFKAEEALLFLLMPNGQAQILIETLNKYAVFYKVTMSLDSSWLRLGVFSDNVQQESIMNILSVPEGSLSCNIDDKRQELWIPEKASEKVLNALPENVAILPTYRWKLFDIQQGIAWIEPFCGEVLIPQECNWELVNGVSFKKGCYTGQEIVTRLHFRGKAKSRVQYFTVSGNHDFTEEAMKVTDDDNKACGTVINSVFSPESNSTHLLASVRMDRLAKGVFLEKDHLPLSLRPLPYSV